MKVALTLAVLWMGTVCSSTVPDLQKTYYVQFIYGSNNEQPPNTSAKAIGPKLSQKLAPVFRWKRYWEMNRQEVTLTAHAANRISLNAERHLEIETIDEKTIELRLYREKGLVRKTRQQSTGKIIAIMGGEQTPDNAWFVVVRSEKPR